MKPFVWDLVRPLHSPLTRRLRRLLGNNYAEHPEMQLPPPYEAVQLDVERNLHRYLHVAANDIKRIAIVGANTGDEVPRLRRSYPSCEFICFEPSPRWFAGLSARFRDLPYVRCRDVALAEQSGTGTFYELPMDGNGSLLRPDQDRWAVQTRTISGGEMESFDVTISTLDTEMTDTEEVDLIWVDVQGAEAGVLRGGKKVIARTKAVFLEVALVESPYHGTAMFPDLDALLKEMDFTCVSLGTDPWNYTGNALWVRNIAKVHCRE